MRLIESLYTAVLNMCLIYLHSHGNATPTTYCFETFIIKLLIVVTADV